MFAAWYDQIHLWNRFFYYDEYWGEAILSTHGVVTSLAWKIGGKVNYVLEGNLNYTGAVITWLKDDLQIISSPGETGKLAKEAIRRTACIWFLHSAVLALLTGTARRELLL